MKRDDVPYNIQLYKYTKSLIVAIIIGVCWLDMLSDLEQRIRIEEIRNDEWFQKNYEPIKEIESEEVNLDDVNAAFDNPEVYTFTSNSFGWE